MCGHWQIYPPDKQMWKEIFPSKLMKHQQCAYLICNCCTNCFNLFWIKLGQVGSIPQLEEDQSKRHFTPALSSQRVTASIKSNTREFSSVFSVYADAIPTIYTCGVHCSSETIMNVKYEKCILCIQHYSITALQHYSLECHILLMTQIKKIVMLPKRQLD